MKTVLRMLAIGMLFTVSVCLANDRSYDQAVSSWQSYDDVGRWLKSNFSFDKSRQHTIQKRLMSQGPEGLLVRAPENLFKSRRGYCADSANFALKSLNRIDPKHNARWVFIENARGKPNHWVTAFNHDEKLYIMDYGTGDKWLPMQGVHGPYDSLDEYRKFLASLSLPGFEVGEVIFRDIPAQED